MMKPAYRALHNPRNRAFILRLSSAITFQKASGVLTPCDAISTYAKLTRYLPPKFSKISPNAERIVSKQW